MKDNDLLPYFQYLETEKLPVNEQSAHWVVLEYEKMEVIDGVLHHDNAADQLQWCIVAPTELWQTLITKAHAGLFSGHLSEWKVYDQLCCRFWWRGVRVDIRHFCRGCLSCVSRRGPGWAVRPPIQPIPVLKPFHRVAVDGLQLPLNSSGNKYVVVFINYFTKWVEAYAIADQQTPTIARLLKILCADTEFHKNCFQIEVLTSFQIWSWRCALF